MRGIETALGGAGRAGVHFRHYAINGIGPRGRFGSGYAQVGAFGYSEDMRIDPFANYLSAEDRT
jgi:hypothetical protein